MAYGSHVHMDEIGILIVANTPAPQVQSGIPHSRGGNSRQPDVNGFCLHMEAIEGNARVRGARTQEFVARWRAVSTDDIDLAAVIVNGRCQVVEQVEQVGIEMVHISRAAVAEVVVEFGQGFRQVTLAAPVDNIESLVGMGVVEAKAVFARGEGRGS